MVRAIHQCDVRLDPFSDCMTAMPPNPAPTTTIFFLTGDSLARSLQWRALPRRMT